MIDRRSILFGLAITALNAHQSGGQIRRLFGVGFLALASRQLHVRDLDAFRGGMSDLGYVEARTYKLVEVFADGDVAKASELARQLLDAGVDIILAPGAASARAAQAVSAKTPVVAIGLHPRGGQTDLFKSLARPGGMVTGLSNMGEELAGKRIELLRQAIPSLSHVGVLHNVTEPHFRQWGAETELAVRAQGLASKQLGLRAASPGAVSTAFKTAKAAGVEAIVVVRDFMTATLMPEIVTLGLRYRISVIAEERRFPDRGALLSYGANNTDLFRRAATFVDMIARGAKPADLPVQQPTKFELVINLKTAKVLGLTIPPLMLARADEVIE